jgi:carbon monoxide dehydrogenase subunit G
MIVSGEYVFSGPRQSVWDLLQDPTVLVKAMPGAKRLDVTADGVYEGVVRIGVGPVTAAEWRLTVVLSDRAEPESYSMQVDSKGPVGFTRGSARVELLSELSVTRMRYHADLQIGGKVAGIGQRLLDQVAKLLTKQGLEALSRELKARLAAGFHSVGDSLEAGAAAASASGARIGGEAYAADSAAEPLVRAGASATPEPLVPGAVDGGGITAERDPEDGISGDATPDIRESGGRTSGDGETGGGGVSADGGPDDLRPGGGGAAR